MLNSIHIQNHNSIQHCWRSQKLELVTHGFVRTLADKNITLIDVCGVIMKYITCFQFTCDDHDLKDKTYWTDGGPRRLIFLSTDENIGQLCIKMSAEKEYLFRCGIIEINKQFLSKLFTRTIRTNDDKKNAMLEFENKILSKAMDRQYDPSNRLLLDIGLHSLYKNIWLTLSDCGYVKDENDGKKPCSMEDNHWDKKEEIFAMELKKHVKQLSDYLNNSHKINIKFVTFGCDASSKEYEYWCDFGMNDKLVCIELYYKLHNINKDGGDSPPNQFAFPLVNVKNVSNSGNEINLQMKKLDQDKDINNNDNNGNVYLNFVKDDKSLMKQWQHLLLINHETNVYYYVFECVGCGSRAKCQFEFDVL